MKWNDIDKKKPSNGDICIVYQHPTKGSKHDCERMHWCCYALAQYTHEGLFRIRNQMPVQNVTKWIKIPISEELLHQL